MTAEPLLRIEALDIAYEGQSAVAGFAATLNAGGRLGIVGESGSGKSSVGRALLGLLPPRATARAARLDFAGAKLPLGDERSMAKLRGARIALVPQDPKQALNPVMRLGTQLAEAARLGGTAPAEARELAVAALAEMRIREPARVAGLFPHQVSGGMAQRAMLAMMLLRRPALLVADEPTSALDASVAGEVMALLDREVARRGLALLLISHDLDMVATFTDRVIVMRAGQVVETRDSARLGDSEDPYTRRLLAARPRLEAPRARLSA